MIPAATVRFCRRHCCSSSSPLSSGAIEPDDSGWRDAVVAGVLVALAWWLPKLAVDSWMEFHHEPRSTAPRCPLNGSSPARW
ncbi:MAG: hypothetical protein R2710_02530 [Acidimicrobiales bacterium]